LKNLSSDASRPDARSLIEFYFLLLGIDRHGSHFSLHHSTGIAKYKADKVLSRAHFTCLGDLFSYLKELTDIVKNSTLSGVVLEIRGS
jgi:hypothetical protein